MQLSASGGVVALQGQAVSVGGLKKQNALYFQVLSVSSTSTPKVDR